MKQIAVKGNALQIPQIALGCMRITELDQAKAESLIKTALEQGINFFDHADIYAGGEAESFFAKAIDMNPTIRENMILQSKCAIRPGDSFDFSKKHIIESVDSILKRLNTEYLDTLLLHRPDTLMDPEEVAEAFEELEAKGKVKYFGMSNQNGFQLALLEKYLGDEILFNQLQLSIAHCPIIDEGLNVNLTNDLSVSHSSGTLEYCRLKEITIQAWSPFQYGFFEGVFLGSEKYPELNKVIDELAEKYEVTSGAITIAWILRHPANIQAIVGTTNEQRLLDISKASTIELTRSEWYRLYLSAGKILP